MCKVSEEHCLNFVFNFKLFQKYRQSSLGVRRARKPAYSRPADRREMGFAKQTVSSTLKQQPEILYEPKRVKIKSPAHNDVPEGVHVTFGTPKQRDREIVSTLGPVSIYISSYTFVDSLRW